MATHANDESAGGGETSAAGYPVVNFLEIDGKVLSGEEFEDYCKNHGLCRRCARIRTHRRVLKLFGRGKKWEPMTLHDEETGEYTVYKGYCLQPTCYTIGQAKRLLGETGNGTRRSRKQRLQERFKRDKRKRPGRRRAKTNPETGSVMSGSEYSTSNSTHASAYSQMSASSTMSGLSGLSGFSGIGSFRKRGSRSRRSASTGSAASSEMSFDPYSDDDTIDSTQTPMQQSVVAGEPSPIVAHRVEQLMIYDYFTVLDLSKVELRPEDLTAVVGAMEKTKTLESVVLDKCKLKDDGLEQIAGGLKRGMHIHLKKVSLRQNTIGNRGAQALDFLLRASPTLEELDLSENSISSRGAASILSALHENRQVKLHTLNLSQNEIWDMDDGTFLRDNTTLKVLNMDGNFMHDEGAEQIAKAVAQNKHSVIEKLYLGWNGISDDGATALAKMMEVNSTLQVLGLAENDISNTGARAILSALAVNTSVREISGLYHNQIDRKFIIVAIKRLLHRYGERTGQPVNPDHEASLKKLPEEQAPPPLSQPQEQAEHELSAPSHESKLDDGGDVSQHSGNSINWAAQLYSEEARAGHGTGDPQFEPQKPRTSVALEAIEHWDWGTFGIEEIEASHSTLPNPEAVAGGTKPAALKKEAVPEKPVVSSKNADGLPMDRVTVFQSAPLAYFNRQTTEHHEIPLLDFGYEAQSLKDALTDTKALGAEVEFVFENATSDRMNVFFSQNYSPVMHISCYGHPDCLTLENGFGYMQSLPRDDLNKIVKSGNANGVRVAVVSSCHANYIADMLVKAGIPHVVSCQRESVFRDEGPVEFAKSFYQSMAKGKMLRESFKAGLEAVRRSPKVKTSGNINERFVLHPMSKPARYHDVKIFFQNEIPPYPEHPEPDTSMLPPLPNHFVGREVDMYEILESLRVDDVVRVGGPPGSGKATVVSAVSRYVLERPKSFQIDSVFWLPPPPACSPPDPDSLYGDLCKVINWLVAADDDMWDDEEYTDCRERIMVEMEDKKTILVIDGRMFTTEAAGENLERFLTHLLNEANVKIILITAHEGYGVSHTKRSRSEETIIAIGPLAFKSSCVLFGNACEHISVTGNPVVHTAEEFASFLVPPSVQKLSVDSKGTSRRQRELFARMGKGNPKNILECAKNFTEQDLDELLRFAQRPDVHVDSAGALEKEMEKRTTHQQKAIHGKNYLRAQDMSATLDELESLKKRYPSLSALLEKEKALKAEFSSYLSQRKYDDANQMKRKILALKKIILKEKHAKPHGVTAKYGATGKLQELQAQMDGMLVMAGKISGKGLSQLDPTKTLQDDAKKAIFAVNKEGGDIAFKISCGSVFECDDNGGLGGMVCWSNESCDLETYDLGKKLLEVGGQHLQEDVSALATLVETSWGPVKCATGEAVSVGPRTYSNLMGRFVILSVSPLSPTNDDDDWDGDENQDDDALHYLYQALRASYRSSVRKINDTGLEVVSIPMISTIPTGSTYLASIKVGLQTLVEESKFSKKLNSLHLIANSGKEANLLIKMALEMGLKCLSG